MIITIIVLVSIAIGFLGGAALASLRKAPEMPTITKTPTIRELPMVPEVPTKTRKSHPQVWN